MTNRSPANIPQQSLPLSVLYHLFPGLCILAFYLIVGPWLIAQGFQPIFGVLMGFVFVGIPVQLTLMLREGYKTDKRYSLANVIHYTNKIPVWQYLVMLLVFVVYAFLMANLLNPFNSMIMNDLFSWTPQWFRLNAPSIQPGAPTHIVTISFMALLIVDGVINPVVEELYFRGFLMPRISRFGWWTPVISALLFSLAHFWQPWNALLIFMLVVPIYFLVFHRKSIFISIVLHCAANLIGALLAVGQYMSAHNT